MIELDKIVECLTKGIAGIMSLDDSELFPDSLLSDIGIDSLGLVELFVFIEKEYNIKLLDSGLTREDIQSINSLAIYIQKRI